MANKLSGAALLGQRVREMLQKKVSETKASNKKSNKIQTAVGPVSKGHALLGALITGYKATPRGATKIGSKPRTSTTTSEKKSTITTPKTQLPATSGSPRVLTAAEIKKLPISQQLQYMTENQKRLLKQGLYR